MRCGTPPFEIEVRQIAPREKYATADPSGEKNGVLAPMRARQLAVAGGAFRNRSDEQTPQPVFVAFGRIGEPPAVGGNHK